jgi:hypothetical protein
MCAMIEKLRINAGSMQNGSETPIIPHASRAARDLKA